MRRVLKYGVYGPLVVAVVFFGLLFWLKAADCGSDVPAPALAKETVDALEKELADNFNKTRNLTTEHGSTELEGAATYIQVELEKIAGSGNSGAVVTCFGITQSAYVACSRESGIRNIQIEFPGDDLRQPMIVVGAHYDSARGTPGANDNGSGVVAGLYLARSLANRIGGEGRRPRTIRIVFFVNEEEPYFSRGPDHKQMGSGVYAAFVRSEKVQLMISLETMAYFTDEAGTQCLMPAFPDDKERKDPPPISETVGNSNRLPVVRCKFGLNGSLLVGTGLGTGNFLAVVSTSDARKAVQLTVQGLCSGKQGLRIVGIAAPDWSILGFRPFEAVTWSDHAPFLEAGVPAVMITDTAPARYPYYHHGNDTYKTLKQHDSFNRFALAAISITSFVWDIAGR